MICAAVERCAGDRRGEDVPGSLRQRPIPTPSTPNPASAYRRLRKKKRLRLEIQMVISLCSFLTSRQQK